MATRRLGIIMHGVTGRMGMNQHLIRSIVAIRDQGGVALANGDRVHARPDPGRPQRREDRGAGAARTASRAGAPTSTRRWPTTTTRVFFDAGTTQMRPTLLAQAIARRQARLLRKADRHQPRRGGRVCRAGAGSGREARRGAGQAVPARPAQARHAAPTPASSAACSRCAASSATGCSRATCSRSSGRAGTTASEDGGGIILDMMCHWRYVLDNLFGEVKSVSCLGATHIPQRWDEARQALRGDRRRRRLRHLRARGPQRRAGDRADEQLLGDARAPRRPGDLPCRRHARLGRGRADGLPRAVAGQHAAAGVEPRRSADMNFFDQWQEVPDSQVYDNGFKIQWEHFIRHVVEDAPYSGRCPKAPRACSWSRPRCRAGRNGAGSTCRRWI